MDMKSKSGQDVLHHGRGGPVKDDEECLEGGNMLKIDRW